MSIVHSLRAWRHALSPKLRSVGSAIAVLALLVGGFWGSHSFTPRHAADTHQEMVASEISREVTLPQHKIETAGIHVTDVDYVDLQQIRTVAATIDYDSTRRLSIKTPVECVVEQLIVKPGQMVIRGEPLAVFSGAEVALARSEIRKCEAEVQLSTISFDSVQETQNNLAELLSQLKTRPSVEDVEESFDGKLLGEHRDHLLTAYSKYVLASNVAKHAKPLGEEGIIAGRTAESRLSQRDVAAIAFQSACELSEFEGRQKLAESRAELEFAQQKLAVAKERLRILLGPLVDECAAGRSGDFELRAPFDGRIELLHTAPGSRLAQGESVLSQADTTTLWVSALIHQHDWEVLQAAATETVKVTVPAVKGEQFSAQVSFVGPEVSATTRAISLVAELRNDEGRLRPGMFAWVDLPLEPVHLGLTVPTSAIQRHESQPFVMVQVADNHFRRIDVSTGLETAEYVEIMDGLSTGDQVVDQGAFYLKSELLLGQEK